MAGPRRPRRVEGVRPRRARPWRVLLAALVLYAVGVLIASTTGGGEGSGACEETPVVVDVCNDGGEQG